MQENYPDSIAVEYLKIAEEIVEAVRPMFSNDMPSARAGEGYENLVNFVINGRVLKQNGLEDIFIIRDKKFISANYLRK